MGNGATNPNTASGMLPATSNSSPYIITSTGELEYAGVLAWKAFDQLPVIGDASSNTPADLEYLNTGAPPDSGSPDWITEPMKRGIMVDLGEGNEKCFDKFTFAKSAYMREYYQLARIIIQGSNSAGVSNVTDDIGAENWDTLFKSFVGAYSIETPEIGSTTLVDPAPELAYGSWYDAYFCWQSTTAYRYYRVMFGCEESAISSRNPPWSAEEEWEYSNQTAVSELRFIEEEIVPEGTEIVFVPTIECTLLFSTGSTTKVGVALSIAELNIPEINGYLSFASTIKNQYLGIDVHTVLLLQMNGEVHSSDFIDSSQYHRSLEVPSAGEYDGYPIISFDDYAVDGFSEYGWFDGHHTTGLGTPYKSDTIIVENSDDFDLGIDNTPFCIDFRILYNHAFSEEEIIISRHGSTNNDWSADNGIAYKLSRVTQGLSFEYNIGGGAHVAILCPGNLIEDFGYVYPTGYYANWHHIAVTYDGTTTRMFCDGVEQGTPSLVNYFKPTTCDKLTIGAISTESHLALRGALDEFRISNGICRWASDFDVPTESYIEAITERIISVPAVVVTELFFVAVYIIPEPLVIPEITVSTTFSGIPPGSPGWVILVPDIPSVIVVDSLLFLVTIPVQVQVDNILTCRILEVISTLNIPVISVAEELSVIDVFLGSKVQVPTISISNLFEIILDAGWRFVSVRSIDVPNISTIVSRSGQHIFIQEGYPDYRYKISHDFGASFSTVVPLTLPTNSQSMLRISGDGQTLIVAAATYTVFAETENLLQISFDSGATWAQIGYHWYYNSSIHVGSQVRQNDLLVNDTCSVIYVNQVAFDSSVQHKNWIRSTDSGVTWHNCNTGYALPVSTFRISLDDFIWDWDLGPAFEETWYNPSFIYDMQTDSTGNIIIAICKWYIVNPDFIPPGLTGIPPMFLFVGDGVIVSEDAGATWHEPVFAFYPSAFQADDTNFQKKIVSVSSDGTTIILHDLTYEIGDLNYKTHHFISTDIGTTWQEIEPPVDMMRDSSYWTRSIDPITFIETPVYIHEVQYRKWVIKVSDDTKNGLCIVEFERCFVSTDYLNTWTQVYPVGNIDKDWSLYDSYISSDGEYVFLVIPYTGKGYFRQIGSSVTVNSLPWHKLNRQIPFQSAYANMSSSGDILVALAGYLYESTLMGKVWWPVFGDGWYVGWTGLSISDNGQVIVATANISTIGGMLFISNDAGSTWRYFSPECVELDLGENFTGFVASTVAWWYCSVSGDGNLIFAGTLDKNLAKQTEKNYYSTDAGVTWLLQSFPPSRGQIKIVMNYTGNIRLAAFNTTLKKYSSAVWTTIDPSGTFQAQEWCVAINYDGTIMIAGSKWFISTELPGRLYKSSDSGVSWSEIRPAGDVPKYWTTCSISDDGTTILAGTTEISGQDGQLYISYDSGSTWTEQLMTYRLPNVHYEFSNSCITSDGNILCAGGLSGLWTNRFDSTELITLVKTLPDL